MSKNIAHPLTEDRVAELWDEHVPLVLNFRVWTRGDRLGILDAMCAAHDAGRAYEREHANDGWEPLGDDEPLNVGDEVKQEWDGITHLAVVGSVDNGGDPWAAESAFIGCRDVGTWSVRRAVQELPTEDGAVIVPADGSEFIEQVGDCANYRRLTYDAASGRWIGWDMLNHEAEALSPEYITPGTWRTA